MVQNFFNIFENFFVNFFQNFDELGHRVVGAFNITRCLSFKSLTDLRNKSIRIEWDTVLQNNLFQTPNLTTISENSPNLTRKSSLSSSSRYRNIQNLVWNKGIPSELRNTVYSKISEIVHLNSENSLHLFGGGRLYYNALVRHFEYLTLLKLQTNCEDFLISPQCSSESTVEFFDTISNTDEEKCFSDGSEDTYMPALSDMPNNRSTRYNSNKVIFFK